MGVGEGMGVKFKCFINGNRLYDNSGYERGFFDSQLEYIFVDFYLFNEEIVEIICVEFS